ncbi:MAG: discoidin domain-containing protein [Verrucomicrobia bacterium]|nr:discoidin domain-containing protein [Verrucomicrobiota bacterium]
MSADSSKTLLMAGCASLLMALFVPAAESQATVALALKLPMHTLKGTPLDLPKGPNVEPLSDVAPTPIQVPKDVKNLASGKTVTSSVNPFQGELKQLTDGNKEPVDDDVVEFKKGTQWVQVDLGQSFAIHAVAVWHDHRYIQAMRDVVLQVSDDPEFKKGVTTLYNNDTDNTSNLGVGTDREYFELEFGRVLPAKGVKARYVRSYIRGSNQSALNCWQEIEVYALPAK